jgi:diguanylate cyclase (GGDEF)-like protein
MLRRVSGASEHVEVMEGLARSAVETGQPTAGHAGDPPVEVVAYPLGHDDEVLGAVVVGDPEGGTFSTEARAALVALSRQAGTAVHNVQDHRETQRLSVTDPLTGAGNFRHLSTTLAREVERALRFDRPLSVLMLDLDHFKEVNDTWGHARGDTVLRELARRLGDCVREVDTVARYGGEEFALVLPETDLEGAEMVAQRVVESVGSEPFTAPDAPLVAVTVSVGVAAFPLHGHNAGDVMRAADRALYAAKSSGRNQWCTAATEVEPTAR